MRACLILVLLFITRPVWATTPEEMLAEFFAGPSVRAELFDPAFLQVVPLKQLNGLRSELVKGYGAFERAYEKGADYEVRFARAVMPVKIALNSQGQIGALWFGAPLALDRTLDQVASDIAALPGVSSFLVLRDGEVLASHQAEASLAVGSAFKLSVLLALKQEIDAGRLTWNQVVPLREEAKALPTGFLQTWPTGTAVTIATLANLMMSISDNTATDNLIALLGPSRIEQLLPPEALPLLTARQYFQLGGAALAAQRAAYLAADEAGRRAILADIVDAPLSLSDFVSGGAQPDFGWHLSNHQLCDLMEQVVGLPALAIDTGGADATEWQALGYKGGAVAGAMNMTTGFVDKQGRFLCTSMTWNQWPTIDTPKFQALYAQLLALLPRE